MICEVFNNEGKFIERVIFDENWSYQDKVELWEIILVTILFLLVVFFILWWLIPIRFLFKKSCKITFYCKKGE